jgi:hypothetical protein
MAKRKAKIVRLCRHAITCLPCRWSHLVPPETYITIRELHSGSSQEREVFYSHRYCSPSTLSVTYTHRPDFKTKKMEGLLTSLSVLVLKVVTHCIVTALWRLTRFRPDKASTSDRKAVCKNPGLVTSLPPSAWKLSPLPPPQPHHHHLITGIWNLSPLGVKLYIL